MHKPWDESGDPWIVKSTAEVHHNDWFAVESNDVIRPDGSDGKYQVVRMRRRGAGVLAIGADGAAHMIGQWRLPLARYSWEMPMGSVEPGETVLAAAKRELSEESGITASDWIALFDLDVSTSLTDERCSVFMATGLEQGRAHPEGRERIRRRCAPFMELVERVEQGLIREAVTVAALMRAFRMAVSGALPSSLAKCMLRRR